MLTIATTAKFHDYAKLDVFKVWVDNDIVVFISVSSIAAQLSIEVPVSGSIRGVDVCTVDILFTTLEELNSPLAQAMASTVEFTRREVVLEGKTLQCYEYEDEGALIVLSSLLPHCKPIPDYIKIRLLKLCQTPLDEQTLVDPTTAIQLLRKYSRKTTKKSTTRGFGKL